MRITIVTPTRNRAGLLPAAIQSVLAQNYPDVEHIVVDGLSSDETPAVLARYPHVRVIRGPDAGLYDALNKGIAAATGEVIGHLNDDDVYRPGAFAAAAGAFADADVEVVSGGAEILDREGRVLHHLACSEEIALSLRNMLLGAPLSNARFFRRELYARLGRYDLRYPITADRDFLIRVALAQPRAVEIEQVFYEYRSHAGSLTFGEDPVRDARWREEHVTMAERLLSRFELPAAVRACARAWHERETAHLAADALFGRRWPAWKEYAQSGLEVNRAWPLMFLRHLPSAFLRRWTVSIILPIYNRERTLRRCLESVRAQTYTDWELLAADDASADGSAAVVESFGDPRVRLLRRAQNGGASAARNTALAAAQGEWVALIDSDDEWLPTKLERQLAFLRGTGVDGCGCEYWRIERGREVHVRLPDPPNWVEALHTRCEFTGTTPVLRRSCTEAIGPMKEGLHLYDDWDWMLRFTRRFSFRVLPEPLARYHYSGAREPAVQARNAELFLARNDAEFRTSGWRHYREVRGAQLEYVATGALTQRSYALGWRYLLRAVLAAPWRKPALLAALALAPVDALLGTALLHRLAGWETDSAGR